LNLRDNSGHEKVNREVKSELVPRIYKRSSTSPGPQTGNLESRSFLKQERNLVRTNSENYFQITFLNIHFYFLDGSLEDKGEPDADDNEVAFELLELE